MDKQCENCRFWREYDHFCRRFPPPFQTEPADWCGEWQGKECPDPISSLFLSIRASKAMIKLGIATIGQLCSKHDYELLEIRNFGPTTLREVQDKLRKKGLSLLQD